MGCRGVGCGYVAMVVVAGGCCQVRRRHLLG